MFLFSTEVPFRERRRTSDTMEFGNSTGDIMVEVIGGTERVSPLMCRQIDTYSEGYLEG